VVIHVNREAAMTTFHCGGRCLRSEREQGGFKTNMEALINTNLSNDISSQCAYLPDLFIEILLLGGKSDLQMVWLLEQVWASLRVAFRDNFSNVLNHDFRRLVFWCSVLPQLPLLGTHAAEEGIRMWASSSGFSFSRFLFFIFFLQKREFEWPRQEYGVPLL